MKKYFENCKTAEELKKAYVIKFLIEVLRRSPVVILCDGYLPIKSSEYFP